MINGSAAKDVPMNMKKKFKKQAKSISRAAAIKHRIKDRVFSLGGSLSGSISVLGSYQVCHSLCIAAITLLAFIGITVNGLPFLFLQSVAIPFWIAAVILLMIIVVLHLRRMACISKASILFNSGLIVAGFPFKNNFAAFFYVSGGVIAFTGLLMFINRKVRSWKAK